MRFGAANMQNAIPSDQGGNTVQSKKGIFFQYQTPNIASLAAGATVINSIQFDNNSVFNWLRTTVFVDLAGAAQTESTIVIPLVTVQIQDTGSGMSFMNAAIPLGAMSGYGALPYVLPVPQLVQPNASLQFTFNNYSASTTYTNLRLQLHGFRIFN